LNETKAVCSKRYDHFSSSLTVRHVLALIPQIFGSLEQYFITEPYGNNSSMGLVRAGGAIVAHSLCFENSPRILDGFHIG